MLAKVLFLCAITGSFSQEIHESRLLNLNTKNQIIQKFISGDVKSWLSPNDGNIATENTPIYAIKQKPKTYENEAAEYKIYEYKNTTTTESPNFSTTPQLELQKDMNAMIADMLKQQFPNSGMIFPTFRTTTPKPSLPYPTTVYPEIFVLGAVDGSSYELGAVDGSSYGQDKICLIGNCVDLN